MFNCSSYKLCVGLSPTGLVVPEHRNSVPNYSQSVPVHKSEPVHKSKPVSIPFQLHLFSKHSHKVHLEEGKQPNSWTDGGIGVLHLPPRRTDFLHQSSLHRRSRSTDKTSGQQTARGTGNEQRNWKSNTAQGDARRGSHGSETCWLAGSVFLSPFSWCQVETGGIWENFIQK